MDTPAKPPKKCVPRRKIPLPEFSVIDRTTERFLIEKLLVEKGVFLINPATKKYLDGLINLPAVHLTFTPPPARDKKHGLGFLPGSETETKTSPMEIRIDATLYFSGYPTDDYFPGIDEQGVAHVVIQTWHDAEVEKWHKIAHDIALIMSTMPDGSIRQTVKFYITSTFIPNNPQAPHQLILKPRSEFQTNAIGTDLEPFEDLFYEEDY